jgi:hypothetical protein
LVFTIWKEIGMKKIKTTFFNIIEDIIIYKKD